MNKRETDCIIVDMTMVRIAETILEMARQIERGIIPDTGTVQTLRSLSKAIVTATTEVPRNDHEG